MYILFLLSLGSRSLILPFVCYLNLEMGYGRESSARVRAHKLIFRTGNSNVLDVGVGIY